ncbi:recombinase family protein [Flavobacterium limi]|uniref:Resolvase n=1 Tax=Flavobacterium limi TaxID=2045105 RepID=A0ABQ1V0B1_9FLAO|nr:recombinase family protein [Flavobacterium limi]GGF29978.1 resolvase [Flavobacterium limi]
MKARYIRISTTSQSTARQESKAQIDELLFIDKVSGAIPFTERPKAKELLKAVNNENINFVSVSSIDRLGRNTIDILKTIQLFHSKGVTLFVEDIGLQSLADQKETQIFKLVSTVMSTLAEMEKTVLLDRISEGIALAKLKGIYKGRVKGTTETSSEFLTKYPKVISMLKRQNKPSLREIAKLCDVTVNTVQKVKRML